MDIRKLPIGFKYNIQVPDAGKPTRRGSFSTSPGSWTLLARTHDTSNVRPGDSITVQIYITGYGQIKNSKLLWMPSQNFIAAETASCSMGMEVKEGKLKYGTIERLIGDSGNIIVIGSSQREDGSGSIFVDAEHPLDSTYCPIVFTEKNQKNTSFINFYFTIRKNVRPGLYPMEFVFTYFNGKEWTHSSSSLNIKVMSYYERNPIRFWVVGTFLTFIGIVGPWLSLVDINKIATYMHAIRKYLNF